MKKKNDERKAENIIQEQLFLFVPMQMLDESAVTVSSFSCARMLWHVEVCLRACICTVWGWKHGSPAEPVNMHALEFPRSMHSLSPERECVDPSPRLCVSVCVCLSSLICKLNADLSIKADLACVLPADMPVITHCSTVPPKGTVQSLGQVDRDTHACTHTDTQASNLIGMKEANVRGWVLRIL